MKNRTNTMNFFLNGIATIIIIAMSFMCQAAPRITRSSASPEAGGNKILVSATSPTLIHVDLATERSLHYGNWEGIAFYIIQFYYRNPFGQEEALSPEYNYTGQNFSGGGIFLSSHDFAIPAGKIGGFVIIKYKYASETSNFQTISTSASIEYQTTNVPPPSPGSLVNGRVVTNVNTGAIFIGMNGVFRHIYTIEALRACFGTLYPESMSHDPAPIGKPLGVPTSVYAAPEGSTAFLARDKRDGKVYLVEVSENPVVYHCRWIASEGAFRYYKFSWRRIIDYDDINFSSTGTWQLGLDFT